MEKENETLQKSPCMYNFAAEQSVISSYAAIIEKKKKETHFFFFITCECIHISFL